MPLTLDVNSLPGPDQVMVAKAAIFDYTTQIKTIDEQIESRRLKLAQAVAETDRQVALLETQRVEYNEKVSQTLAYISPMRRLPHELIREIFRALFDQDFCAGWTLSRICRLWRRLALNMPTIWSKIRLRTTLTANPDLIRLWLERSGTHIPLDIEISLRFSANATSSIPASPPRPHHHLGNIWHVPSIPTPVAGPHGGVVVAAHSPSIVLHHSPHSGPPDIYNSSHSSTRSGVHWGHIALFYLVEQMPRWSRFVFTFEKSFPSVCALKSIAGAAPLLEEFVVTCSEPTFINENWTWLPCVVEESLPCLRRLELQNVPFKWSSPMLSGLRVLKLGSLSNHHTITRTSLSIDRILAIISSNPLLEHLELAFPAAQEAVLPLTPVHLDDLKTLSFSGHHLLSNVLDQLILPSLTSLILDIEPRDTLEDSLANLITRSSSPPLTFLSLAYGTSATSTMYYTGPLSITFLSDMPHLTSLKIGQTALEPLLTALATPEDDWICPRLTNLSLKSCHPHGGTEGVAKLVQMVQGRNPSNPSSSAFPTRLKTLEMYDCGAHVGTDVLAWLKSRIGEVVCVESNYLRSPSPGYY